MVHQFGGTDQVEQSTLHLRARARQFSSFVLVCGTVIGARELEPSHALYVRNKTDLDVVLNTTALPSAKQFKAAVESLSPEMRRFASAFRAMQLESSLFGVAIVQVRLYYMYITKKINCF